MVSDLSCLFTIISAYNDSFRMPQKCWVASFFPKMAYYLQCVCVKEANTVEWAVQIHIDIPRMCPLIPLFQQTAIQQVVWQFDYLFTEFCLRPAKSFTRLVVKHFITYCLHQKTSISCRDGPTRRGAFHALWYIQRWILRSINCMAKLVVQTLTTATIVNLCIVSCDHICMQAAILMSLFYCTCKQPIFTFYIPLKLAILG